MDWTLEVVILPVSDIYAAVAFYRDKVGFALDFDITNEHMHVIQLTPRGSGCSIVIGDQPSQNQMAPGSLKGFSSWSRMPGQPDRSSSVGASRRARSASSTNATAGRSSLSATPTAIPGRCRN